MLLGADIEKVKKAIIVPTVVLIAVSLFVPALARQLIDHDLSFREAVAATFPLTMAITVIWISTWFWDRSPRFHWFALLMIWAGALLVAVYMADVKGQIPNPPADAMWGVSLMTFIALAFKVLIVKYGWASLWSLVCGSFLGLAGIWLLRPGGALDPKRKV